MRNKCIRLFFLVVLSWTTSSGALAAVGNSELDHFIDALSAADSAMMGVVISQDEQVVYERYSGYRDSEQSLPLNRTTQFRIGSITKMYTSVLVLKLIEEGKLSLSTPLSEFFPQVPNAELITIKHLLNHSSGIYNFTNDPVFPSYMTEKHSRQDMIEWIASYESQFQPGETHNYSNSNYILLGQIVEKIHARCFGSVLRKVIAKPLELSRTGYSKKLIPQRNQALSYTYETPLHQWFPAPVTHSSVAHAAGAVASTPLELTQFVEALAAGKLISHQSVAQMATIENGFGLGLFPFEFYGKVGFGHAGAIDAFQSAVFYFPEQALSIALITNGMNYPFYKLLTGLLSLHFQQPFDYSELYDEPMELDAEALSRYEGVFRNEGAPAGGDVTLFVQNDHLHMQIPGQPPLALEAYSESEFRLNLYGIYLSFKVDATGATTYDEFHLLQGGMATRFVRLQ